MNKTTKLRLQKQAKSLRHFPGVYQMLDKEGEIIYIGKSIDIQRRVTSYFSPSARRSKKITRMIHHIYDFQIYYTETELDALLLECRWIKQYKPFYNTALTRQHRYVYVDFYEDDKYRIGISKEVETEASLRLGPFTNHGLALSGMQYIKQREPYFSCEFKYKNKIEACYPYQFKMCDGICNQIHKKSIDERVEGILGEESTILDEIDKRIGQYAEQLEFERAGELVRQRKGVQYLKAIYRLFKGIERQKAYIGVLEVADSKMKKYYLINNGRVITVKKAYKYEQRNIIRQYKKIVKSIPEYAGYISINEVDELLIVEGFRRGKMKILKV